MRSSEWLIAAYFTYVAIVAGWFFNPLKAWILAAIVFALLWLVTRRQSIYRDLAPLGFVLFAYRAMNWFTPAFRDHHLENAWIVWDRRLLYDFHFRAAIERLGVLIPNYLELCYLLVYGVSPIAIALVLAYRRGHGGVNRFWLAYLAGTLGAYALFPYFPSDPPRTVFPNADMPTVVSDFRLVNLWIVSGYGIHSSVFPSAHVSSAFSAAWGLIAAIPRKRWIGGWMAVYAASVAVATVYGRYHYAADAVAGFAISFAALCCFFVKRTPPGEV